MKTSPHTRRAYAADVVRPQIIVSFLQGCVNGDYFWRPPDSDELLVPFVM